jgi:hypothetical protein
MTADGQRAAAKSGGKCFLETTKVLMNDMTEKPMNEIKVGDVVFAGGQVLETRGYFSVEGFELYHYDGVYLTGSHAVKEGGEWVRVEDSQKGVKTNQRVSDVLSLVTNNHFIICNKVVFADDVETNENLVNGQDSLQALNLEA